jgi:ATP-dependent DNA helicase RecG
LLEGEQPNIAGILLAGTPRALKRHVPQTELDYYHHDTNDLEFEFRETLLKPLPALLERLRELIQARNQYKSLNVGLFQIEVWDYDEVVYREAILNALVHRDYTSRDTIQIHHHPNKLEISNPGAFAGGVNAQNILRHAPKRRNPVLADALARMGFIERAGIGVDRMYRLLLRHGKEIPEYNSYPDSVVLRLFNPEFDEAFTRFIARKQEEMGSLNLDALIVLAYLKRELEGDRFALAKALQLPEDQVSRALKPLETGDLVVRYGENWSLSDAALGAIGKPIPLKGRVREITKIEAPQHFVQSRAAVKQRVIETVEHLGSVANRDVRALLGVNLSQASHLLRVMTKEGLLVRTGDTPRATRYELNSR